MIQRMQLSFFCIAILCASSAFAADFVVENGQTVNVTQTLADDGDQGLFEQGGVIDVDGIVG